MITGIHHVSMKCRTEEELRKAKEFYLGILGLTVKREWPEGVMIDAGNCMIEIFSNGPGIREKGAIRHIAFGTDNADAIVQKVKDADPLRAGVSRKDGLLLRSSGRAD